MGFIDLFRSLEKYQAHDLTNIYLVRNNFFNFEPSTILYYTWRY